MSEVTSYTYDLREVTSLLIKSQGITEGIWTVGFEFGLGAGWAGPVPAELKPTAFVSVVRLQLTRYNDDPKLNPIAVDAAEVNPTAKEPSKAKPRRSIKVL